MKSSIDEIGEILEGILRLQDIILKRERSWIETEAKEDVGNVAQIEVYNAFGTYSERLKLDSGYRIVKTNEEPKHLIRVHIDTLIDLLTGDLDFGEAYAKGLIEFRGENFHLHAIKWAKGFSRLRKYLNILRR